MPEEKQFDATPSRLEKARREGDVARSAELASVAAFAAGLTAACAVCAPLGAAANRMLRAAVRGERDAEALVLSLTLMLVPAACAALAAFAANVAQSGGLHFVAPSVKIERLNPGENLKRMISRETAVTVVRSTVAFLCAGAVIVPAFVAICSQALHANGIRGLAWAAWAGAIRAAGAACATGAAFAAVDYGLQVTRRRKRLRMSHDEVRRDRKENDGDPLARSRRRSLHRRISRESVRRVRDAAFVVTTPTHLAVALEYRPPEVPVPRVLVSAAGEAASRVREAAALYGVPVIENVPLARALHAAVRPGEFIPQQTYLAVAEIVAALAGKRGST